MSVSKSQGVSNRLSKSHLQIRKLLITEIIRKMYMKQTIKSKNVKAGSFPKTVKFTWHVLISSQQILK